MVSISANFSGGRRSPSVSSTSSSSSPRQRRPSGIFVSACQLASALFLIAVLFAHQTMMLIRRSKEMATISVGAAGNRHDVAPMHHATSVSALRQEILEQEERDGRDTCRFYLAQSPINNDNAGLGIFAGVGLHKGDTVAFPDICIFVSDAPDRWTHMSSHTWGRGSFFGQYEGDGRTSRGTCGGVSTLLNTMPDDMINTVMRSPVLPTTAGLHRGAHPGAGAVSHHYGMTSATVDVVTAGSELTHSYGDWDFERRNPGKERYRKPARSLSFLRREGWCIDHIEIRRSNDPQSGRGAFAVRHLSAGTVVAPAPLQVFEDRKLFQTTQPEQLFVNYCLQHPESKMLFFPYGAGVNLVNHGGKGRSNVRWQWSNHTMHKSNLLQLPKGKFFKAASPGDLILELVATRNIEPGEEILVDYGERWEAAWTKHFRIWTPPPNSASYVYPEQMDETEPLRTVTEQIGDPYADNLATMCFTPEWNRPRRNNPRKSRITWWETDKFPWWEGMSYCHILDKHVGPKGDFVYTVSVSLGGGYRDYDPDVSVEELFIDEEVPRRAIRFVEKPYRDDEHLPNVFRHPIGFPDGLFPPQWKDKDGGRTAI